MRSIQIVAVAAIGVLLVVTVAVAQRFVSDEGTNPDNRGDDVSRRVTELEEPTDPSANALDDLQEITASRRHELVVTVRDEAPLEIWKRDGQGCIVADQQTGTISISQPTDDPSTFRTTTEGFPLAAKLTRTGGCESLVRIMVADSSSYDLHLDLGHGVFSDPVHVLHQGASQNVTLTH